MHATFQTAKLSYELGFVPSHYKKMFDNGGLKAKPSFGGCSWRDYGERYLPAPELHQIVEWLWEQHDIHVFSPIVRYKEEARFIAQVNAADGTLIGHTVIYRHSPDVALEDGIQIALENLKKYKGSSNSSTE